MFPSEAKDGSFREERTRMGGDVSRPLNLPSLTPHTPFSSSHPFPLPRSLTFRQIISSALRTVDHRPHTRVRRVRVRRPVRQACVRRQVRGGRTRRRDRNGELHREPRGGRVVRRPEHPLRPTHVPRPELRAHRRVEPAGHVGRGGGRRTLRAPTRSRNSGVRIRTTTPSSSLGT